MKKFLLGLLFVCSVSAQLPPGAPMFIFDSGDNIPGGGPYSPTSFAANNILIGNGAGPILASGTTITGGGNVLTFAGGSTWTDASGAVTIAAGGTSQGIIFQTSNGTPVLKNALALSANQVATFTPATGGTATTTPGIFLNNITAAIVGATVQYSPSFVLGGEVWNTTAVAANNWAWWRQEVRPVSGLTPTSALFWSAGLTTTSTPSFSDVLSVSNSGLLSFLIAGTSNTTGISFASDMLMYRISAGNLAIDANTAAGLNFKNNGTTQGVIGWSNNNVLTFYTNGVNLALTLTSSQNAVFMGTVSTAADTASVTTVASGTAYTMTSGFVNVTFGTTSPTVTLGRAGTYLIHYAVQTSFVGATYASLQQVNYLMNRQNNTPATIAGTSFSANLAIITTVTDAGPNCSGFVLYTTAGTTDVIGLQADVSATPSAGSVTCSSATITATWVHP